MDLSFEQSLDLLTLAKTQAVFPRIMGKVPIDCTNAMLPQSIFLTPFYPKPECYAR